MSPPRPPTTPAGNGPLAAPLPARLPGFLLACAATLLSILPIAYAHRDSLRTLISAHGLLHTAIAQRFASTSAWPGRPENPFFAGEPLPYYWVFHYVGARVGSVLAVHPLYAFELLIFLALFALWWSAAVLGRRLYGGYAAGLAVGLLALAGTNPFGVAVLLAKIAMRGTAFLEDHGDHFWGLLHPIFGAARLSDPFGVYGPLLNFYFNISSRPLALSLLLLVACCALAWLQSGRPGAWLGLVTTTAACTAFSFLIGIVSAFALSGGLLVAAWQSRRDESAGAARNDHVQRVFSAVAALLIGVGVAAPTYYYFFFGTHEEAMRLTVRLWAVQGIAISALPLTALAWIGVRAATNARRAFLRAATLAGCALIAGSALVELPASNDCNLFHAGAFLLAIPGAGGLLATAKRVAPYSRLVWTAAATLFLSTPTVVASAYFRRPPIALEFRAGELVRLPRNSSLARLYDWIRAQTPADAVFILDPRTLSTPGGSIPEFPALTRRCLFTGPRKDYMVAPHADAPLRYDLALHLLEGAPADDGQRRYLQHLHRPLYLVVTNPPPSDGLRTLIARYGAAVFRDGDAAVFLLP